MFQLTQEPLEKLDSKNNLKNPKAGALVTFEGWVRNHNEGLKVSALEYEAYEEMANKEGLKILEEAKTKDPILTAHCIHRFGRMEIGEMAVWIGVVSAHRRDAFKACQYIIDEIKTRLPIWKKEHYENGTSGWIACAECMRGQSHRNHEHAIHH